MHKYKDGSESIITRVDSIPISVFSELDAQDRRPIRVEKYIDNIPVETIDYIYEGIYRIEIKEDSDLEGNYNSVSYLFKEDGGSKFSIAVNKNGEITEITGDCHLVYLFLKEQLKNKPNEMLSPFLVHSLILEEALVDNDRTDRFILPNCFNLRGNLTAISNQISLKQIKENDFVLAPFLYPARYGEKEGHFQKSLLSSNSGKGRFNGLIGNENIDKNTIQKGLFGKIITNDENCL